MRQGEMTSRQADRHRQVKGRQVNGQMGTWVYRYLGQMDIQVDRYKDRYIDRQVDRYLGQIGRQIFMVDRQILRINRQIDIRIGRQIFRIRLINSYKQICQIGRLLQGSIGRKLTGKYVDRQVSMGGHFRSDR